ncbi:glycosyltransferase family 2 protein [Magnetococcus sp. PR-3]|uniref:glycosyltransferase family 2 protein n=1 Tax=Magnetococcus sp. PR-3 TaxID=3120355 RepID=UPI002FCDFA27
MTQTPTITVLISAYNSEQYLTEAVESILLQTETDFECLLLDDGSSDGTWQLMQSLAKQDHRVNIHQNPKNIGLTQTLNRGLKMARGRFIARLDADDVALPQRLALQRHYLENTPHIDVVGGGIACFIDEQSTPLAKPPERPTIDPWMIDWQTRLRSVMIHPAVMFRKQVILELGGYDSNYTYSQDFELWGRPALQGRMSNLSESVIQSRQIASQISLKHKQTQQQLAYTIGQRNLTPYWPSNTPPTLEEIERLRFLTQFIPQTYNPKDFHLALMLIQSFQHFCRAHPGPTHVMKQARHKLATQLLSIIPLSQLHDAWQVGLLPALFKLAPMPCMRLGLNRMLKRF